MTQKACLCLLLLVKNSRLDDQNQLTMPEPIRFGGTVVWMLVGGTGITKMQRRDTRIFALSGLCNVQQALYVVE